VVEIEETSVSSKWKEAIGMLKAGERNIINKKSMKIIQTNFVNIFLLISKSKTQMDLTTSKIVQKLVFEDVN
jgi:hypothetical protein